MLKFFIKENFILMIILAISSIVLFMFSYLTVNNYTTTMEKEYIEGCNQKTIEEIENGLTYGKTLGNYYGLDDVLQKTTNVVGEDKVIVVCDPKGKILGTGYPKKKFPVEISKYNKVSQEIKAPDGNTAGSINTYFTKKSIKDATHSNMIKSAIICGIILIITFVVFIGLLMKTSISQKKALIVIIVGIILQGVVSTAVYSNIFKDAAEKNVYGIASYVVTSIESVQDKGIKLEEIEDVDEYLDAESRKYDFIQSISLEKNPSQDSDSVYTLPINNTNLKVEFNISSWYITKKVISMMLAFFATVILAVILMIEMLKVPDLAIFRKTTLFNTRCESQYEFSAVTLRLTNFLVSTFSYMCLSFAALQIKEWNQGCWGMSPAVSSAMAVSLCTLAEAVGMIILPIVSGKLKKKNLMRISTFVLIVSNLICFFTKSTWVMLVMRILSGFGFAGNKQVNNVFISTCYETEEQKQSNLTESNAGIIGGILCGMGLGSVISGVFGFQTTFVAAGVGFVFYLFICLRYVPWKLLENYDANNGETDPENKTSGKEDAILQLKKMMKMLTSVEVWKRLIFIVTPQYLFLMIIVTLIPGRTLSAAMPENVLTYCNLLNGVCGLYIGGFLGKFIIRKWGKIRALTLTFIFGVVSILIINAPILPVVTIIVSAIISGLLDGAGTPLATDLFLDSKAIREAGDDATGLMLFSTAGFVVMAVAPILLEICESNQIVMYITAAVLVVMAVVVSRMKEDAVEKTDV